jgi:hypothetical protein
MVAVTGAGRPAHGPPGEVDFGGRGEAHGAGRRRGLRRRSRLLRGLAPPTGQRDRGGARLGDVHDHAGAVGRPARSAAGGPRRPHRVADAAVSAGEQDERDFNALYERAAHGSVEHWNLPDADHTRAIRAHPDEYEERVAAFFDGALL